jgi:hypothetical protein
MLFKKQHVWKFHRAGGGSVLAEPSIFLRERSTWAMGCWCISTRNG